MFRFVTSIAGTSPEPFPSSTEFDASKVNPGPIGGLVFLALTIAVVILLFSFNRHIKRVNFEQDESEQ
ncbi:MAG: hypothetical protein RL289_334 [Actinomycetota bacterium]|jgi:hypothetical protein